MDERPTPRWVETVRQATRGNWPAARTERLLAAARASRMDPRRTTLRPALALAGLVLAAGVATATVRRHVESAPTQPVHAPAAAPVRGEVAPAPAAPITPEPPETGTPATEVPTPGTEMPTAPAPEVAAAPAPRHGRPERGAPEWKRLAQAGRHDEAFAALQAEPRGPDESAESLLLAADSARLSRHPREARAWLERLLRRHPRDARAPVAAFTLGRVLLDELGESRAAAEAFARAHQAGGSLAPDALAREVEAWAAAGEPERARARAQRYLQLYPDGDHATAVRRSGRL